jgi:hypothetical protein
LDVSKFVPGSLFYMPGQAEQSFFTEHRDGIREVLDPAAWIRNTTLIERAPEPVELLPVRSEIVVSDVHSRIGRAVDKYLTAPVMMASWACQIASAGWAGPG